MHREPTLVGAVGAKTEQPVNAGEAGRVTLAVAQENTGINFGLIATKMVRVSGQVISSQGTPVTNGAVTLIPASSQRLCCFSMNFSAISAVKSPTKFDPKVAFRLMPASLAPFALAVSMTFCQSDTSCICERFVLRRMKTSHM